MYRGQHLYALPYIFTSNEDFGSINRRNFCNDLTLHTGLFCFRCSSGNMHKYLGTWHKCARYVPSIDRGWATGPLHSNISMEYRRCIITKRRTVCIMPWPIVSSVFGRYPFMERFSPAGEEKYASLDG